MQPQLSLYQSFKIYLVSSIYSLLKGALPAAIGIFLMFWGMLKIDAHYPLGSPLINFGFNVAVLIALLVCIYVFIILSRKFLYQSITRPYADFSITASVPNLPWNVFFYFWICTTLGGIVMEVISTCSIVFIKGFYKAIPAVNLEHSTPLSLIFIFLLIKVPIFILQTCWPAYVIRNLLKRYSNLFQIHFIPRKEELL
jgi:hypothetical protein